jgi:hypothetical protein
VKKTDILLYKFLFYFYEGADVSLTMWPSSFWVSFFLPLHRGYCQGVKGWCISIKFGAPPAAASYSKKWVKLGRVLHCCQHWHCMPK